MVTLQAPDLVTSSPAVTVIMQLHKDRVNCMAQARRESLPPVQPTGATSQAVR